MLKNVLLTFSGLALIVNSCKEINSVENQHESAPIDPIENLNIQTDAFWEIDKSGILFFPLKMGENKDREDSYSYKEMPYNGYWNILFYNSETKETNLLTEDKVLIMDFSLRLDETQSIQIPKPLNHIFYEVRSNDFNNNKLLDEQDPTYLYVSDRQGKKFRQLSPSGYKLKKWSYIERTNKIIISATRDSNKNLKFDDKDEIATFELVLDQNETAVEIFDNDIKAKLKTLYDKDWKRLNVQ